MTVTNASKTDLNWQRICNLQDIPPLKVGLNDGQAQAPDEGCTKPFAVKLEAGEVWLSLK